jgi:chitinase
MLDRLPFSAFESLETRTLLSASVSGLTPAGLRLLGPNAAPAISVADVAVTEANVGTQTMVFTVTRAGNLNRASKVNFRTVSQSALEDIDFVAQAGSLNFPSGVATRKVRVTINNDTTYEGGAGVDQNFTLRLNPVRNARGVAANLIALGAIEDNDAAPTISIADASVAEGNTGSANQNLTVTLSNASDEVITVDFDSANATATAGTDYTALNNTLTIPVRTTTATIALPVLGDALDEANETLTVTLSNPDNATIADANATVTITDDDATPTLSVADVTVAEGTATVTVTITLSAASGRAISVDYDTADDTALDGDDYTAASGTANIAAGATTATFTIPITNDALDEASETLDIALSNPTNATIADGAAVATITDNDATPTLSIDDVTVDEDAGTATFTITLSAVSGQDVDVDYATANGTATAGTDYTAATGTATIAAGDTTATVVVTITNDATVEANETYTVTLADPVNATILDGTGAGVITNED